MIWPEENESLGVKRGWLEHISVRRPWRKRGVAKALIADSLRMLRDMGMDEARARRRLGEPVRAPSGSTSRSGFRRHRRGVGFRQATAERARIGAARHRSGTIGPVAATAVTAHDRRMPGRPSPARTGSRRAAPRRRGGARRGFRRRGRGPRRAVDRHPGRVHDRLPDPAADQRLEPPGRRRSPSESDSATLMNRMGLTRYLHPDFGSYEGYGIPVNLVTAATPRSPVAFTWPSESDAGPYPIPASPKIEGAGAPGDRHILMLDTKACRLWELFAASKDGSGWSAGSGAIFDLRSNALRPDGWTSADAAGLPIYPGLARYEEVAAGADRPRAAVHGARDAQDPHLSGPPPRLAR